MLRLCVRHRPDIAQLAVLQALHERDSTQLQGSRQAAQVWCLAYHAILYACILGIGLAGS